MSPDPRLSLARRLELESGPDLLDRWAAEHGFDEAWLVFREGVLTGLRSEPAQVLEIVERVRAASGAGLDSDHRGRLERLFAHALKACGRMKEADAAYARSWKLLDSSTPIERARTATGWSDTLALVGRAAEALEIAERGRQLLGRRDPVLRARIDGNLGTAYYLMGRLEDAAKEYRSARRRFLRAAHPIDAAVCAWNLGSASALPIRSGCPGARGGRLGHGSR
jgi:tetratricopeptide (TPR) repeat protein